MAHAVGKLGGSLFLLDRYSPESVRTVSAKMDTKDIAMFLNQKGMLGKQVLDLYKDIPDSR